MCSCETIPTAQSFQRTGPATGPCAAMSTLPKNSTPWTHWPRSESELAQPKGAHADIHNDAATRDIKGDS